MTLTPPKISNRRTKRRFWLQHIVSEVNEWGGAYGVGMGRAAVVTVSSTPIVIVILGIPVEGAQWR